MICFISRSNYDLRFLLKEEQISKHYMRKFTFGGIYNWKYCDFS